MTTLLHRNGHILRWLCWGGYYDDIVLLGLLWWECYVEIVMLLVYAEIVILRLICWCAYVQLVMSRLLWRIDYVELVMLRLLYWDGGLEIVMLNLVCCYCCLKYSLLPNIRFRVRYRWQPQIRLRESKYIVHYLTSGIGWDIVDHLQSAFGKHQDVNRLLREIS